MKAPTNPNNRVEGSSRWLIQVLPVLFLFSLPGCKCLPEPTLDATAPTAGLLIEYRVPGGSRVSKTFLPTDADVTINASKSDVITVLYSGGDNEGTRKIELEYDIWRYIGSGTLQQGLLLAKYVQVNCPKKNLAKLETFDPSGVDWRYKFTSRADNWVGTSIRTATVTIITQ